MRLIDKIKRMFTPTNNVRAFKRRQKVAYAVLWQSKYYQDGVGLETYMSGSLFEDMESALKFASRQSEEVKSFRIFCIQKMHVPAEATYAVYDYTISAEHPNITMSFKE